MKLKLQYLRIELKKTLKMFPRMLLQAILLMFLIGAIAFCGVKSMGRDPLAASVDIVIVVRDDNTMTKMALSYVEDMESVSELCHFRYATEEEGFELLEKGEAAVLILLPEQLVEGIMNGTNPSVDIYFPKNAGLEALLFKELTESGEGLLRVAQAQIYGAGDMAREYGLTGQLSGIEAEIDRYNLAFALDRMALYHDNDVSVFGSMNSVQFYLASGSILFLLLSGMAMYPVVQREPAAFQKQLERQGAGLMWQRFCQWLCGFLCMGGIFGIMYLAVVTAAELFLSGEPGGGLAAVGRGVYPAGTRMGIGVLIVAAVNTLIYLLLNLAGSRTSGIMLVFVCSVGMIYLSGGIVPSMFLPEAMQAIGKYLPTTYLIQAAGGLLSGQGAGITGRCVAVLGCYTMVFGGVAYLSQKLNCSR